MMPHSVASLKLRPTWAEVSLATVRENLKKLAALAGGASHVLFVVKANAYGHGAVRLARMAQDEKLCGFFGVSSIEEGITLRHNGITLPILVLGSLYPFTVFREALANDLSITVASLDAARKLSEIAKEAGVVAKCHVKVDTGMGRIGSRRPGAVAIAEYLDKSPHTSIEGIYTHLSSVETDTQYTHMQLRYFADTIKDCTERGIELGIKHAASSAAAVLHPESRFDMIRPGIAAYGNMDEFSPALQLKSRIVFLKDMRAGSSVSYGRSFRCRRQTRLATIPIGYADGYMRCLSNTADLLIGGKRCRIVGNITMDMLMADVTHVPEAAVGDEVVLIGRQGDDEITAGDLALLAGTIPYETLTAVSTRVPRIYT